MNSQRRLLLYDVREDRTLGLLTIDGLQENRARCRGTVPIKLITELVVVEEQVEEVAT